MGVGEGGVGGEGEGDDALLTSPSPSRYPYSPLTSIFFVENKDRRMEKEFLHPSRPVARSFLREVHANRENV